MLNDLALYHKTDKSSEGHNYCHVYEELFEPIRYEPLKVVEIGVWQGGSCRMWADYFVNSIIYGVDVNPKCEQKDVPFNLIIHDATKETIKDHLPAIIDVVIDDGSHDTTEQIATLELLFPLLSEEGIYIIEDIYTQMFGTKFYNYQKQLIDLVYERGDMSITFHKALTIIRKHKEEKRTK